MDQLYTIQQVADKLKLSDKTLRRWEEAGRFLPSRTLGNQRRYSLEDLQILDALKHNVINSQKELLSLQQAADLCGVSPSTIDRWENLGLIHPFITSGRTYYPKSRLLAKLDELKAGHPQLEPLPTANTHTSSANAPEQYLQTQSSLGGPPPTLGTPPSPPPPPASHPVTSWTARYQPYLVNLFFSLALLVGYHFLFGRPSPLLTPTDLGSNLGSVQGIQTTADPRLDDLILKFNNHLASEMLKSAQPPTQLQLTNVNLISGSAILPQTQSTATVLHPALRATTQVTATFTADFSPAKKYWITPSQGSFTLHTDFPVGADTPFTYTFVSPLATPSALPN